MYKLTMPSGKIFTIPKSNIGLLAFQQAQDKGFTIDPKDVNLSIEFLKTLGIKVEDNEKEDSENV